MKIKLAETEFEVLRKTIATRGTTRMVLLPVTFVGWATLTATFLLFGDILPVTSLLSLAILVAGFEAIHALHVGVERVGRYLQVQYESEPDGPRWETTAMAVGPALPGGGIDPLFSAVFMCAAVINLVPAALPTPRPTTIEAAAIVLPHAVFMFRVLRARGAAARQRAVELESFKALLLRERDREQ